MTTVDGVATGGRAGSANLVFTDYWFLAGIFLAVLWAVDPLQWELDLKGGIKTIPILFVAPAALLTAVGMSLRGDKDPLAHPFRDARDLLVPLSCFSFLATAGSVYARLVTGTDITFLTMGLYPLTAPLTAWFVYRSPDSRALVRGMIVIYILFALLGLGGEAVHRGDTGPLHAREHVAIGSLTYLFFIARSGSQRTLALLLIVAAALAVRKNTAYLAALFSLGYIFSVWALPRSRGFTDRFLRLTFWTQWIAIALLGFGLLALAYFKLRQGLPTGNTEFRMHNYLRAFEKFISSPLVGNGFTGPAAEKFGLFTVALNNQVLPTHSDPLDMLANGGVLAFGLFFAIVVALLRRWHRLVMRPLEYVDAALLPHAHAFCCIALLGVVVLTFNPILNEPNLAWTFWGAIGALLGMHAASERRRAGSRA